MMQLFSSPTSPFVRKVLVLADEIGLRSAITVVPVALSPVAPDLTLDRYNPLGKIPTLVTASGEAIVDSSVISAYLLQRAGRPEDLRERQLEALADGLLDAGIAARYEVALRPAEFQWRDWIVAQSAKVIRALPVIESAILSRRPTHDGDPPLRDPSCDGDPGRRGAFQLGSIAVAVALGWLDFRKPLLGADGAFYDWRAHHPALARWFDEVDARPSMIATRPT